MTKTRYGYTLEETDYWDLQDMLKDFRKKRKKKNETETKCKSCKKGSDKGDRYQRFHT